MDKRNMVLHGQGQRSIKVKCQGHRETVQEYTAFHTNIFCSRLQMAREEEKPERLS